MTRTFETLEAVVRWDADRIEVTPRARRWFLREGALLAFVVATGCLVSGRDGSERLGLQIWEIGAVLLFLSQLFRIPHVLRTSIARDTGDTYRSGSQVSVRIDGAEAGPVQRVELLSVPSRRRPPSPPPKRVAVVVDGRSVPLVPLGAPDADAIAATLGALCGVPVRERDDDRRAGRWVVLALLLHLVASLAVFVAIRVPAGMVVASAAGAASSAVLAWIARLALTPLLAPHFARVRSP